MTESVRGEGCRCVSKSDLHSSRRSGKHNLPTQLRLHVFLVIDLADQHGTSLYLYLWVRRSSQILFFFYIAFPTKNTFESSLCMRALYTVSAYTDGRDSYLKLNILEIGILAGRTLDVVCVGLSALAVETCWLWTIDLDSCGAFT